MALTNSVSPMRPWNDGSNESVIHKLEQLILRARATDQSINKGEWTLVWNNVAQVMGNSQPPEVCDTVLLGNEYLNTLVAAMGGTIAGVPTTRRVFKMNGTDQYIDFADDGKTAAFLFAANFFGTAGQVHTLVGSNKSNEASSIKVAANGDLVLTPDGDVPIVIPAATFGSIATDRRIEIGQFGKNVRVRVDGTTIYTGTSDGKYRMSYIGAGVDGTGTVVDYSDGTFYDAQVTTNKKNHFYDIDDDAEILVDSGVSAEDANIINYNASGWGDL